MTNCSKTQKYMYTYIVTPTFGCAALATDFDVVREFITAPGSAETEYSVRQNWLAIFLLHGDLQPEVTRVVCFQILRKDELVVFWSQRRGGDVTGESS